MGNKVGTWLSLVERTLGVGEVASSNLVVPTNHSNELFEDYLEELFVRGRYSLARDQTYSVDASGCPVDEACPSIRLKTAGLVCLSPPLQR
jgi:hypothetical protein